MSEVYECRTAEDVWNRAKWNQAWRKKWFAPESKPLAEPVENTEFFAVLVAAAYPKEYPVTTDMPISISKIIESVCRVFGCTKYDLASPRREHKVLIPRQIAQALARRLTARSLPEIGRQFGGRDHTSILHSIRKMQPVIDAAERDIVYGTTSLDHWVQLCKHYVEILKPSGARIRIRQ